MRTNMRWSDGSPNPGPRGRRLVLVTALLIVLGLAAAGSIGAQAAYAGPATSWKVVARTQVLDSPSIYAHVSRWLPKNTYLHPTCWQSGPRSHGAMGWSPYYWGIADGSRTRFVPDSDVRTPRDAPDMGVRRCSTAPTSLATKLAAFVNATRGRVNSAPTGPPLPGQCLSLVRLYLFKVHGIDANGHGDAVNYRAGDTGGRLLAARGFVWSTHRSFRNGDILVFAGGQAGHIGLWMNGRFYDANDYARANPTTANYSPFASGYLGRWTR